jgi:hypothetical protein
MFNNGFELSVEVNGRPIPEFGHHGKTYVEGRKYNRYQLRFRNNRAERVLVVPTVDGLSVLDGTPYHENSPGYVVQGYSSLTIPGWRTSLSEVRAFEFSDKGSSYAGKTVGQQNCGVIGARVYAEKHQYFVSQDIYIYHHHHHWPPQPVIWPPTPNTPYIVKWAGDPDYIGHLCCSAGPPGDVGPTGDAGSAAPIAINTMSVLSQSQQSQPDFNLGTTYGAPIQDAVSQVQFEKGIWLATFEIYYSDRKGLVKDGIPVDKSPGVAGFPQAFGGFCKLPG